MFAGKSASFIQIKDACNNLLAAKAILSSFLVNNFSLQLAAASRKPLTNQSGIQIFSPVTCDGKKIFDEFLDLFDWGF